MKLRLGRMVVMLAAMMIAAPATAQDAGSGADPCTLIPPDVLQDILFGSDGGKLDSWSNHPAPGHAICRWEGRPHGSSDVRGLVLDVYHLPDEAHAIAELTREPANVADPSEALLVNAEDQLVRPNIFVVYARHGANLVILDARGSHLATSQPRAVRYRLDAAALVAAGAMVRPPPTFASADAAEDTGTGSPQPSASQWTPKPHNAGPLANMVEPLVALVAWMASWRFFLIPIVIVGSLFAGARTAPATPARTRRWWRPSSIATIGLAALNISIGPWLSGLLVYHLGRSGSAVITGTFATSTQYNNHDVVGYHVLIRAADGKVMNTSFEDDDFNVYPSHNATRYPGADDRFTVRYLPHFPSRFVIVSDDDSPWAKGLRCGGLESDAEQARRKRDFAPGDAGFAKAAGAAQAAFKAAGC